MTSRAMSVTLSGTTPVDVPDAAIGEQDHFTVLGDAIDEGRVPEVEVAPEVL